jgi:hypothetical protein
VAGSMGGVKGNEQIAAESSLGRSLNLTCNYYSVGELTYQICLRLFRPRELVDAS